MLIHDERDQPSRSSCGTLFRTCGTPWHTFSCGRRRETSRTPWRSRHKLRRTPGRFAPQTVRCARRFAMLRHRSWHNHGRSPTFPGVLCCLLPIRGRSAWRSSRTHAGNRNTLRHRKRSRDRSRVGEIHAISLKSCRQIRPDWPWPAPRPTNLPSQIRVVQSSVYLRKRFVAALRSHARAIFVPAGPIDWAVQPLFPENGD